MKFIYSPIDLYSIFGTDPVIYKAAPEYFTPFQLNDQYEIGSLGTVKSKFSRNDNKNGILKGFLRPDGYKTYFLKYSDKGIVKEKWFYGHFLVAAHFVSNPYRLPEVDHLNNIKDCNTWWNLNWTTHAQNMLLTITRDGRTFPKGDNHWLYGNKASESTKALMAKAKIGMFHPRFKGFYWVKGERYETPDYASKATGISKYQIKKHCKPYSNPYSNFYFESTEGFDLDAWL